LQGGGARGLLFHDLRRSAIRQLVRAGVSEGVCMSISGHLTRRIFDAYNLSSEQDQRDAVLKLDLHLAVPEPQPQQEQEQQIAAVPQLIN
jgi:hypothetical protein